MAKEGSVFAESYVIYFIIAFVILVFSALFLFFVLYKFPNNPEEQGLPSIRGYSVVEVIFVFVFFIVLMLFMRILIKNKQIKERNTEKVYKRISKVKRR